MPSFRSSRDKAAHAISIKSAVTEKGRGGRHQNKEDGLTHSIGTERIYKEVLTKFGNHLENNFEGDIFTATVEQARAYLEVRAEFVSQKTLDQERQALRHHFGEKIERVKSEIETILTSRAYTTEQAKLVSEAQRDSNSISTEIAHAAGLRAHELYTILPVAEREASTHREWSESRFVGRDGERYTVIGKGGLVREVMVPVKLAERLEERRLEAPVTVKDREVIYQKHYDIGGGKAWSQSFSSASKRELGWSNGGHGLRHSYAQERMKELQGSGQAYREALSTVSQEMGHFREDITEMYLR